MLQMEDDIGTTAAAGSNLTAMLNKLSEEQQVQANEVTIMEETAKHWTEQLSVRQLQLDRLRLEVTRHKQDMLVMEKTCRQKQKYKVGKLKKK